MAEATEFRLSRIGQIAVTVKDLERAIAFYRDVLGMPFLFQAPNLGFFSCGDVRLMLTVPEKEEFDHPASVLYYRVDDMGAAHDALKSRGVAFEESPKVIHRTESYELWMGFFRDSEGNLLALMNETPSAGGGAP